MITEKHINNQINLDHYVEVAYKKYSLIEDQEVYKISNKLKELNTFLENTTPLTVENIEHYLKKLSQFNYNTVTSPNQSIQNFVEQSRSNKREIVEALNAFFNGKEQLRERVHLLKEKLKNIVKLTVEVTSLLLASLDCNKYPFYDKNVRQFLDTTLGLSIQETNQINSYTNYCNIHHTLRDALKAEDHSINLPEIQDFLLTLTESTKLQVEISVIYLHQYAQKFHQFEQDHNLLLEAIKKLDDKVLEERLENYRHSEKINQIRFQLIDRVITQKNVSLRDLEAIKENIKQQYETDILRSWNNFTILFSIYYEPIKVRIQRSLHTIHKAIQNIAELSMLEFHEDKIIRGFEGSQHFGTSHFWLAVYETKYDSHRHAVQLFFEGNAEEINYGIYYGAATDFSDKQSLQKITQAKDFNYEDFITYMVSAAREHNLLETSTETYDVYTEDIYTVDQWRAILQDESLTYEHNLQYLSKMFEFGGGASCTKIGESLNIAPQAVSLRMTKFAARIQNKMSEAYPKNADGKDSRWRVLFNGKVLSGGLFQWIMKPNLYKAFSQLSIINIPVNKYNEEHFLKDVFIDEQSYETLANLLLYKQNVILEGPPGVGKTFIAKRLAQTLTGSKDNDQIETVQFHQSYAYEDFIMGFRPSESGRFQLQYGIFYNFCEQAMQNPNKKYFFIIDEINRGNVSKVFGELFMLIENDKRNERLTMAYSQETFTIPENIYLIGTMNTADRSLAQLDVALRRRFSFFKLYPQFNEKWQRHLQSQDVSETFIKNVLQTMQLLNETLRSDYQLGEDYEIGHSFFTNKPKHLDEATWFNYVIEFEIQPLLMEYFFDRREKVKDLFKGVAYDNNV